MKLIMENWKKFLKETAEDDAAWHRMDAQWREDLASPPEAKYDRHNVWKYLQDDEPEELEKLVQMVIDLGEYTPHDNNPFSDMMEALLQLTSQNRSARQDGKNWLEQARQETKDVEKLDAIADIVQNGKLARTHGYSPSDIETAIEKKIELLSQSSPTPNADTDNDGIPDERELAVIDKGELSLTESPLSTAVSAVHSTIDKSDPVKKLERVAAGLADVHGYARTGLIDQVAHMRKEVQLKILAFVEAAGRLESGLPSHPNPKYKGHSSPRLGRVENKLREYIPHIVMAFSEIKQPIVLPASKKSEILDAFSITLYANPKDDAWVNTIKFE